MSRSFREVTKRPILGMVSMLQTDAHMRMRHSSARFYLLEARAFLVSFTSVIVLAQLFSRDVNPRAIDGAIEQAAKRSKNCTRRAAAEPDPRRLLPGATDAVDLKRRDALRRLSFAPEFGALRLAAARGSAERLRPRGPPLPAPATCATQHIDINLPDLATAPLAHLTPDAAQWQTADEFRVIKSLIIRNALGLMGGPKSRTATL